MNTNSRYSSCWTRVLWSLCEPNQVLKILFEPVFRRRVHFCQVLAVRLAPKCFLFTIQESWNITLAFLHHLPTSICLLPVISLLCSVRCEGETDGTHSALMGKLLSSYHFWDQSLETTQRQRSIWRVKHFKYAGVTRSGQMDAWPLGGVLCTCVCSHPCASDRRCAVKWCLHRTCCLAFPAGVGADNQTPIFWRVQCTWLRLL